MTIDEAGRDPAPFGIVKRRQASNGIETRRANLIFDRRVVTSRLGARRSRNARAGRSHCFAGIRFSLPAARGALGGRGDRRYTQPAFARASTRNRRFGRTLGRPTRYVLDVARGHVSGTRSHGPGRLRGGRDTALRRDGERRLY